MAELPLSKLAPDPCTTTRNATMKRLKRMKRIKRIKRMVTKAIDDDEDWDKVMAYAPRKDIR